MLRVRPRSAPDGGAPGAAPDAELRAAAAAAEPDAFVSYAREDDTVAHALADGLRAEGRSVWIDQEKIPYASHWRERAIAGIDASKAVIFVLSRDWLASDACRFELDHAVDTRKRLVPVAMQPLIAPLALPPALQDLVWIPATRARPADAVPALMTTLDDDVEWRDMHARLLVRALEWTAREQDRNLLLRGTDLREAEAWLAGQREHGETATPVHSAYIVASRRESTRRQRVVLGLVAAALLVSMALAAVAYWQRGVAVDNEQEAVAQRRTAEHNARQARSRELAATATAQLRADPELALLLGVEAARVAPTVQAEEVLRAALPRVSGTTTMRHPGLQAIATDAEGRLAITGGIDGLARTWDLATGVRLRVLRGHSPDRHTDVTQGVLAVALTPDGSLAATSGAEGDVRIWRPRRGELVALLRDPAGGAAEFGVRVAFAGRPGREVLVTAGFSGVVRTWDAATGRARHTAELNGFQLTDLAVSRDGGRIAVAGLPHLDGEGIVAAWDAATLAPLARIRTTTFPLALSSDGRRLATVGSGTTRIWDAASGALVRSIPRAAQVGAVALAPDADTVAVAQAGGKVALVDVATGGEAAVLDHPGNVSAIAFDGAGTRLLTGGTDETARLWELGSARLLATLRAHRSPIWHAAVLADGSRLITAGGDGAARVWRPVVTPVARELGAHEIVVGDITLTPDGRRVVSASADGEVGLWDVRTGRRVGMLHAGEGNPSAAASPNGRTLLTSVFDSARLWDSGTGRALGTLPGKPGGGAAFTPDGSLILSSAGVVWDARTRRRVGTVPPLLAGPVVGAHGRRQLAFGVREDGTGVIAALPHSRSAVRLAGRFGADFVRAVFSADGTRLAVGVGTATSVWDTRTGRRLGRVAGDAALPPGQALDRRGDRLLTLTDAGVRIWDVEGEGPTADLPHPGPVGTAAFSADGRLVVTASFDGFARIWEARTGRLVLRLRGRSSEVWSEGFVPRAVFGADGRTVAAATGGPSAFVAECAVCAPGLLAQAADATTRTLTRDERRTFLGG